MATSTGTSHVYGIDRHTLCLASLSSQEKTIFALGTTGITEPAEIHIIDYDPDEAHLSTKVYKHTSGLRSLAPTHWDTQTLLVVNSPSDTPTGSVQLISLEETNTETKTLCALPSPSGDFVPPHAVVAFSASHCKQALVVSSSMVSLCDLDHISEPVEKYSVSTTRCQMEEIEAAACHPTSSSLFSTTDSTCLRSWDTRIDSGSKSAQTMVIESAHQARIRTLDYNPNLPYMIATGADDGHIRIWDARSPMLPLLEIANHSHWIYSVRFNHNHDQLLLSAGGDGLVNLESVVSISSAQAVVLHNHQDDTNADFDKQDASDNKHRNDSSEYDDEDCDDADEDDDDEDDLAKPSDGLVAQFDDHETSVYAAVWSQADPWVFASLSFDGRTVINTVPREEKYKILL